ncbi:uncharacterized protein [Salminus brasiliensis]|uniref:uncharacterized protein n=1 Tax=Salminus brasiliensis TaxID=930266 RepID=UPI003B8304D7
MEQEGESPVAGKAEQQSGSLLYTYFQGDINSMVDAHFSRALSKVTKPKGDISKSKRIRKSAKTEQPASSNWDVQSPPHFGHAYAPGRIQFGRREKPQMNPHLPPIPPAESSTIWPGGPRQGASLVLPPMVYPSAASAKGLVVPDQQYSNSLISLLHSDRPDLGTVMVSSPKQEFIPGWTRHPGFGDQMTPHHSLDSGMQMIDKKDLYWY